MGGGGGVTQATIAIYDKYINNSRRAQYALIVSQNLISNDLLAIKLNKIVIYHICMRRPGGGGGGSLKQQ